MYPTLKDIKTGEIKTANKITDNFNVSWWTDGNGSCDCNRAHIFGKKEEIETEIHQKTPDLKEWQSICFGYDRFIAVDVHGNLEGIDKQKIINKMNSEYKWQKEK